MAERKPASLLDFAIAASIAVVPVLLGVVLLVAVIRPADVEASGRSPQERYVSARQVAALKTFEPAVLRRSGDQRPLPDGAGVLAALPACQREWRGASPWRGLAGRERPGAHAAAAAGRAGRGPARRLRRRAARLRQPQQRAGRACGRLRRRSLVRRRRRGAGGADREPRRAGASVPPALRRPRRCARHPGAQRRRDARQPGLARQREPGRARPLARGAGDADPGAPGDAAQSLERRRRLHLLRRRGRGGRRRATLSSPRRAAPQRRVCALPELARADVPASAPRTGRRCGKRVDAARRGRSGTILLAGEPGLADPLDDSRWSVPPSLQAMLQPLETLRQPTGALYRLQTGRRRRGVGRRRRPARRRRTGSSSTAAASTSASRSTSRSTRRCRRWRRRPPPATPAARTSAARSACIARPTRSSRSASRCSKARWCGWRRSR